MPFPKLQRRLPFTVFLILSFVLILVYWRTASDSSLMIIEARSRSAEYDVVNPLTAKIGFRSQAQVRSTARDEPRCETGLLEPRVGARAKYLIYDDVLIVRLEPPANAPTENGKILARFVTTSGPTLNILRGGSIAYGGAAVCNGEVRSPVQLPIWGPARIGEPPRPVTTASSQVDTYGGLLLGGDVSLFGRTIDVGIFGLTLHEGDSLYPAGKITLPVGSRLFSAREETRAAWFGFALYDPNTTEENPKVMRISASSDADVLFLDRLGGNVAGDKIEVGLLTQLFSDPAFLTIQLILAGVFFISEFVIAVRDLWGGK